MATILQTTLANTFLERLDRTPQQIAYRIPEQDYWRTRTFAQFFEDVELGAFGLLALGLLPRDRVALISNTRYEWTWIDYSTMGARGILVPVYPSSTPQDIAALIQHSESRFIFVEDRTQLSKVIAIHQNQPEMLASVQRIIVLDQNAMVLAHPQKLGDFANRIVSLPAVLELGRRLQIQEPSQIRRNLAQIQPQDPFTIVYTSGTTGTPKGAVLTHDAAISVFEDCIQIFGKHIVPDRESTLSFLPYSHIIGRIESLAVHVFGWQCSFAASLDRIMDHLQEVRPTILFAVPRIFEKARSAIQRELNRPEISFRLGKLILEKTQENPGALSLVANLTVRRAIAKRFGGRLKFALCGGAPLSPELGRFFAQVGILALEGYGLTETCAPVTFNTPDQYRFGTVGKPLPEVQIKTAEDGEILIRSRKLLTEYWQAPQETAQAIQNGWFHTGDIGQFDSDGFLQITDRKKDLIITSGGKNVAPQKIENRAKDFPLFSHFVVVGEGRHYLSALICLDIKWLEDYAQKQDLLYSGIPELLKHPKILQLVQNTLHTLNQGLASFETIKRFVVLPRDFTVEAGELTPSLKIRRDQIEAQYKTEIDRIYATA